MVESGTWQNVDGMKRDTMAGRVVQDIIDNLKNDYTINIRHWYLTSDILHLEIVCFQCCIHEQMKICEFKPRELELQTDVLCNRVVLTTPHPSVCVQSPWPWRCQSGMKDDLIPCCIIQWETARIAVLQVHVLLQFISAKGESAHKWIHIL